MADARITSGWPSSTLSCRDRRSPRGREGGWQQGLEPHANGAGRAAGSSGFRIADGVVRANRRGRRSCPRLSPKASACWKAPRMHAFGGARRPLLVSVRSGAAVSMPGMMETVLDVGLNADTVEALIRETGNPRLAWDSYRRLVQGYAEVVAGLPTAPFDALVAAAVATAEVESERELDHRDLRTLTRAMLASYRDLAGEPFPADPGVQLLAATQAVLRSWDAEKAVSYRRLNGIDDAAGTAVTVQTMVFGNAGGASGAGVGFTRNPATGARELYFDFQFDGQGEDVVAGRRNLTDHERLRLALPAVWTRLNEICRTLETLFGDAQDFEFTVQSGELFLLQTRRAKRTDWAALAIAVDMVGGRRADAEGGACADRRHRPRIGRPHQLRAADTPTLATAPGGEPWGRKRRDRARPGCGPAPRCGRQTGNSRTPGHGDVGHRGHGAGRRNPDRVRRSDLACGGRRTSARQGVPGGLPSSRDRSRAAAVPDRGHAARRGRHVGARRQHRGRACGSARGRSRAPGGRPRVHSKLAAGRRIGVRRRPRPSLGRPHSWGSVPLRATWIRKARACASKES